MRVTMTVERTYYMDEKKVLTEPGFDPPGPDAAPEKIEAWLRESFYELAGFERDVDHVDGSYVWLVEESVDADFMPDAG